VDARPIEDIVLNHDVRMWDCGGTVRRWVADEPGEPSANPQHRRGVTPIGFEGVRRPTPATSPTSVHTLPG
jgi:hypothetical protein